MPRRHYRHGMLFDRTRPWLDPTLTALNRLPIRPATVPCPDLGTARRHDPAASPWWRSLDGTWDFTLLDRPEAVDPAHLLTPAAGGEAAAGTIEVPGAWTLQGHGHPHYTNIVMPFGEEPPLVPEANPTGVYRRTIGMPREWTGRRTVLRVGAAESMVFPFVDGRAVGMATDSRLASEFDVTHLVRPGRRHTLALVVLKWSAATWLEDQDQWWHGGLQRGVALFSTAASHLMAAKLVPGLAEMPQAPVPAGSVVTGQLGVELAFDGPLRREPGWTAEVRVETLRGRQVATTGRLAVPVFDDSSELNAMLHGMLVEPGVVHAGLRVDGAAPWSAEDPRQYRALVTLRDPSGTVVEVDAVKVGFRSVEVRDRRLLVNGAPVVIRGANVHEHDPDRGRAVGRDLARRDLEMVKAANLNAVRGAHYPHDEQFAELCDELGLYLVDEADVETHSRQWSLCHDPRFGGAIVERVERMARRDVHHPSVILWSLGNESGYGAPHDEAAAFLRRWDPSRPLHYEGPFMHDLYADGPVSDVVCPMYRSVDEIVEWARRADDPRRPLILCEYTHAMGNSCGSLVDYDDAFETVEGLQGGFIWEWVEHGIPLPGAGPSLGHRTWGHGGDFGGEPNDAHFIFDGLVDADRTPHPPLEEVRWLGRPVRCSPVEVGRTSARVTVSNRRWFTDTSDLMGEWSLAADGEVVASGDLGSGGPGGRALGPRSARELRLRWPAKVVRAGAEHHLTLRWRQRAATSWAPRGAVVGWDQFAVPVPAAVAGHALPPARAPRRRAGAVADPVLGEWRPSVFRALTDNDGIRDGWMRGLNGSLLRWVDALHLDDCTWDPVAGTLQPAAAVAPLVVRSSVAPLDDGWHRLSIELALPAELDDPPRLGVVWALPGAFDGLEWLGDGPHECYSDRRGAAVVGRWRSTVWDQYVPYGMPQEHGHHTGLRWVALTSPGDGVLVVGDGTAGFSARHHSDATLWGARHTSDLAGRGDEQATFLAVDVAQRGIGQSSLGAEALAPYRVRAGRHGLDLLVRAFDPRRDDPGALYATRPR